MIFLLFIWQANKILGDNGLVHRLILILSFNYIKNYLCLKLKK